MYCLVNPKLSLKQRTQFVIEQGSCSGIIPTEIYKVGCQPMTEIPLLHVKEGGYPTRIQGCSINSPMQSYEREMLKSVTAIAASLYCIVYCREDTGQILLTRLHEYLDQLKFYQYVSVKSGRPKDQ